MICKIGILLLAFLSVFCGQIVEFRPERVIVVDKTKDSYLVRGNIPLVKGQFRMDLLKKQIEEKTKLKKGTYDLKVISLMNHFSEKESHNLAIEEKYFEQNTDEAQFAWYPVLGFFANPTGLPQFITNFLAYIYEKLSSDKLDFFVDMMRQKMRKEKKKPTVYYFHCSHGADRTGMISAAYKMKYLKKSFKEVMDQNEKIANRKMFWAPYNGLMWFCQHLQRKQSHIDCGEVGGQYHKSRNDQL